MVLPGSSHEKLYKQECHPVGVTAPAKGRIEVLGSFQQQGAPHPVTTDFATTISAGGEKGAGEENVYENPSFGKEEQKTIYIL